jgi:aminopeptidase
MALSDPRIKKQAKILVDYSLKVKQGEKVVVNAEFTAKPLVLEIYKLLITRGANEVKLQFSDYEFTEAFYKLATDLQLKHFPQTEMDETKAMDCYIRIGSPTNTRGLSGVDTDRVSQRAKVTRPILNWRVDKTRWVVTKFPTDAQAQEADMSLSEYEDFVFKAINGVDWQKKYREQEKLRKRVDSTKKVHIVGEDTDLRLGISGRKAENAGGKYNMPDGEVFTSVVENQANGFITYTYPALYLGREYNDIRIEFKGGKVVKATSSKGEKDLQKILNCDPGARRIGELGLGNNYNITRFTKDILFDEKIGGSIHLALGRGYKETGSLNESAIHWDMIKDLRRGGQIFFDDKLVQKNGKWLI